MGSTTAYQWAGGDKGSKRRKILKGKKDQGNIKKKGMERNTRRDKRGKSSYLPTYTGCVDPDVGPAGSKIILP